MNASTSKKKELKIELQKLVEEEQQIDEQKLDTEMESLKKVYQDKDVAKGMLESDLKTVKDSHEIAQRKEMNSRRRYCLI